MKKNESCFHDFQQEQVNVFFFAYSKPSRCYYLLTIILIANCLSILPKDFSCSNIFKYYVSLTACYVQVYSWFDKAHKRK